MDERDPRYIAGDACRGAAVMPQSPDVKIVRLTRFLFTAPEWPRSLAIIIVLGLLIDGASITTGSQHLFFGTLGFIIPALIAFLTTKPLVGWFGKYITWNRSALLALSCMVFGVITTLSPVLLLNPALLPLLFAIALGLIFGVRLLVLVAIADYRIEHMLAPALMQSLTGLVLGTVIFDQSFLVLAVPVLLLFGAGFTVLIWLIERPLRRAFQISGLRFLNVFIAHLTDGSKSMEDFFREIGDEVYVPQTSLFFTRESGDNVIFTVPNVHPGPMGEVGGGNLPRHLNEVFQEEVLVTHGCATHDFNLVSESEISKIAAAMKDSRVGLRPSAMASRSRRVTVGSVKILCQRFGDALLMVSTRDPEVTEDIDYSIGITIMAEGHRYFSHIAFVDAHNSMAEVHSPVVPASRTGVEYLRAGRRSIEECHLLPMSEMKIGVSHVSVPFSRDEGFGDLGIQALVLEVEGQRTAYVLLDGNNMAPGVRAALRRRLLRFVDEAEIMSSDTHVVNTITGKNPIGMAVPVDQIEPFVERAVREAASDLSPARAAAATACCERIVVFGSQRVSQLASTVNTMLSFIAPLSFAILALAFLLSFVAYLVLA